MEKIIECINLSKSFPFDGREKEVIKNLNFSMYGGNICSVLGLNGAGKTTLVRMLSGILLPDYGTISIFGKNYKDNEKYIKSSLSVCIGGDRSFYYKLTALENLEFFGLLNGISKKILRERIQESLRIVGLELERNELVETFSKGMKQKLLIAKALLNDSKLIILDEPTSGLDISSQFQFRSLIKELNFDKHKSILLFTHNLSEAEELGGSINILHNGKLINQNDSKSFIKSIDYKFKTKIIVNNIIDDNMLKNIKGVLFRDRIKNFDGYVYSFYCKDVNIENLIYGLIDKENIVSIEKLTLTLDDYLFLKFRGFENECNY